MKNREDPKNDHQNAIQCFTDETPRFKRKSDGSRTNPGRGRRMIHNWCCMYLSN